MAVVMLALNDFKFDESKHKMVQGSSIMCFLAIYNC